ncbi:MAG TPA: hypothetical protein VGS10_21405 [Terracidiphilus sp.]|nr:hypothetical protein [Terracidiphilus sp.]
MKLTVNERLRWNGLRSGWLRSVMRIVTCVMAIWMAGPAAQSQSVNTTTVQGTVYLANGQPAGGTLEVSWPTFSTAAGQLIAAGKTTVTVGADGFVSVNLTPNVGATPAGEYYTATFYKSDGTVSTQYWVVPAAAQASLAQVQAQVMPAAQAVQAVSKAYVDQAVSQAVSSQIATSGGNLTGPLYLSSDPTQPLQAADKHYVDSSFSAALPLAGGAATGPLTATQLGAAYQVDQFPGVDFGAKLQACLNAVNSTYGGTCDARNFTGTLSMGSNLTISTANTSVELPCATISTANQLIVTAGTRNVSLRGCALRGGSAANGNLGGTVFEYSGTGPMVQVGDPAYVADTPGFHLDNVAINTTGATSATAQGMAAYRTQEMDVESVYLLGNSNQTAMTLDGTGNYTGGTFFDDAFNGFGTAVNAIGHQIANAATTDWLNASTFVRLHIDCPTSGGSPIAGTIGINLQQGDGNTFTGGDVEGCSTALHLGPNAQNNTIMGLRNENSVNQAVADAGSAYNNWITGGTIFTGKLTDNGTRNSFLDTFHRSFNGMNGDWYGSQQDATVTNHYRLGTGTGNERGLQSRYQTDYGYRWTTGLTDATAGEQFYQVRDELNNVDRVSVGQYLSATANSITNVIVNNGGCYSSNAAPALSFSGGGGSGAAATANMLASSCSGGWTVGTVTVTNHGSGYASQPAITWSGGNQISAPNAIAEINAAGSTNNQTVLNAAGTGAVILNGSNNSGTGGVAFGSGGPSETTVATINNAGNAQFNGTLQVGGASTFTGSTTVKNQADAEIDSILQAGLTAPQKESLIYRDFGGDSQWYMVKDQNNNWALNSATGNLDSFKAYQSTNSGDTYINAAKSSGVVRVNYETGAGTAFNIYGGGSTNLYASFGAANAIKFPGLAASSGDNCLQIDNSGYISNTGSPCGSGSGGMVGSGSTGQIAYFTGNGTTLGGMNTIPVSAGGTGASTAAGALSSLLPGVASDGNSGATIQNNLEAATLSAGVMNGVWDFKAKFGATGSNETMSCTATSGSSSLTSCSSGDFAVGEYIYIPFAGDSPTISTPSAPSAACGSDNGGSCTGSTQYCYEIAATQTGYYNPPMTAPSSATCVTQADQTAQTANHNSAPDVYTAINWSPVTNAAGYAVYKSINSGPYKFYEYVTSGTTSIKDFNHAASAQFTCADMGYPCTAPSGTTASGLYAQITAINGGTYTIAARSTQPAGPSRPGISGSITVQHDDSPAFAAAYSALLANAGSGSVEVHIPAGNYVCHGYNDPAGTGTRSSCLKVLGLSNVTFSGDGPGITNIYVPDSAAGDGGFIDSVAGYGTSYGSAYFGGQGQGYALEDPSLAGGHQITLAAASDGSHFTAGGYITIFNNASGYPWEYYGEINKVLAIDSTTGVLTLAYPLSKTYSAALPAPYSTCSSCNGTPMAYPIGGGPVASNISFQDFSVRGPVMFANVNTIDGLYFRNMNIQAQSFMMDGQMRHVKITNSYVMEDPWTPSGPMGILQGAAASTDLVAQGNTYVSPHYNNSGRQECSEGGANIADTGNTLSFAGSTDPNTVNAGGALFGEGMCWNYTLDDNTVTLNHTSVTGVFGGDASYGGSGTMKNNTFSIDSVSGSRQASITAAQTFGAPFNSPYVVVDKNQWLVPAGTSLGPVTANANDVIGSYGIETLNNVTGGVSFYPEYGTSNVFVLKMSAGNISNINMGSTRIAGYKFSLIFVQPASGSQAQFQFVTCANSFWSTGNGIDCANRTPPNLLPGNGAETILDFYDDGTILHYLGSNFSTSQYQAQRTLAGISGNINLCCDGSYGQYGIQTLDLTGNVTQVVPGGNNVKNLMFALSFVQPSTGGPYTLPSLCGTSQWGMNGTAIDFIGGACPALNPAAGSTTTLWFYDDGANVHEISRSYWAPGTGPTTPFPGAVPDGSNGIQVTGAIAAGTSVQGPNMPISLLAHGGICNGTFDNAPILNSLTLANKGKSVRFDFPDGEACGIGSTVKLYGGQTFEAAPGGGVQAQSKLLALASFSGTDMVQLQQAPNNLGQAGYFANGKITGLMFDQGTNTRIYAVQPAPGVSVTDSYFDLACSTSFCLRLDSYAQGNRIPYVESEGGATDQVLYINGNDNQVGFVDKEQGAAGSTADPYIYLTGDENSVDNAIVEGTCSSNKAGFSISNASDTKIGTYHDECNTGSAALTVAGSTNTHIGTVSSTISGPWITVTTSPSVVLDSLTDLNNGAPSDFSSYVSVDSGSYLTIGTFSTQVGAPIYHLDALPNVRILRFTTGLSSASVSAFSLYPAPGAQGTVTNGDFAAGLYDWSTVKGIVPTAVAGPYGFSGAEFNYTSLASGSITDTVSQGINITSAMLNHPYTLTFWVRSTQHTGDTIYPYANGAGVSFPYIRSDVISTLNQWDQLSMTIIPTAAGTLSVGFQVQGQGGAGGTIIDVTDFSLEPGFEGSGFNGRFQSLELGGNVQLYGTAAPTTGTWKQGAYVWNSAPSEQGTAGSKYIIRGWSCVSGGSPGTWVQDRGLTGN